MYRPGATFGGRLANRGALRRGAAPRAGRRGAGAAARAWSRGFQWGQATRPPSGTTAGRCPGQSSPTGPPATIAARPAMPAPGSPAPALRESI